MSINKITDAVLLPNTSGVFDFSLDSTGDIDTEDFFEVRGKFSTAASESEKFVSQIGFMREEEFILQKESEIEVSLTGSDLLLDLTINGDGDEYLSFGEGSINGKWKSADISSSPVSKKRIFPHFSQIFSSITVDCWRPYSFTQWCQIERRRTKSVFGKRAFV